MEFIFALLVLVILFLITCRSMASIERDIHRKADPFDSKCEERKQRNEGNMRLCIRSSL